MNLTSFAIGLTAGIFGGLAGLGGGVIMIPLMVRFLRINQHGAHGTSLVALIFTGISGAIIYGMDGALDITAAVLLAVPAIAMASLGARFAHSLSEWKLKRAFGGFLIFAVIILFMKPFLPAVPQQPYTRIAILLLTGVFAGFLSGMMGVGGGSIMVPAMVLLAGFSQHSAQGTSLLVMVPAGAMGAFTHWRLGNVRQQILPGLIAGILIGTLAGGLAAHRLPESALRFIFGAVVLWTGFRYLRTKHS